MTTLIESVPSVPILTPVTGESVIRLDGLTKYFGSKCVVDSVNLAVPRGSVFALLGRNGSGKSTLVRMLLGLLAPTRGSATILGDECRDIRPATRGRIGYVAEAHPLIDWMRVSDLEAFQRSFYRAWDRQIFKAVIDHFALSGRARAYHLSRGQRAGLSLALVLATRPELLVMDDPALGLDPIARRTLLEAMILVTRDAGRTILFTSHELADVERVADHIAIMDLSVLRVAAPVDAFRDRIRQVSLSFPSETIPGIPPIQGLLQHKQIGSELLLMIVDDGRDADRLANDRMIHSLGAITIREIPVTLEDTVVAYLGDRGGQPSLLQEVMQ